MSKGKVKMTDNLKIGENRIIDLRNPNGTFKKGTQIGRMKKRGYTLLDLTKVAMEYDNTHDVSILKHYIEQLMEDNRLLENFINKYVPLKQELEVTMPKIVKETVYMQAGEPPKIIEDEVEKSKQPL
jgi:hypothetical protein